MYSGTDRGREVINAIEAFVKNTKFIGRKVWSNIKEEADVFELVSGENKVWCSFIELPKAGEGTPNRKVIYLGLPTQSKEVVQVMDLCVPYEFSKRYSARVYECEEDIELRIYGKFSIGRKCYKADVFINYLKDNGYANEVRVDSEHKEYVRILQIDKDLNFNLESIEKRFNKWVRVVNEYKKYYEELCA